MINFFARRYALMGLSLAMTAAAAVSGAEAAPINLWPENVASAPSDITDVAHRRRYKNGRLVAGAALGVLALGAAGVIANNGRRYDDADYNNRRRFRDDEDVDYPRYRRRHQAERRNFRHYGYGWRQRHRWNDGYQLDRGN